MPRINEKPKTSKPAQLFNKSNFVKRNQNYSKSHQGHNKPIPNEYFNQKYLSVNTTTVPYDAMVYLARLGRLVVYCGAPCL